MIRLSGEVVHELLTQRLRIGALEVSVGTVDDVPGRTAWKAFRVGPGQVGLVVSDDDLDSVEEDLRHICGQGSGRVVRRQTEAWISHRLAKARPEAFLLVATCDRTGRRESWHAGGLEVESTGPAGWRAVSGRLRALWSGRANGDVCSQQCKLPRRGQWLLTARLGRPAGGVFWLKIEAVP